MKEEKKNFLNWQKILKIVGIVLAIIIFLALVLNLIIAPVFSGLGRSFNSSNLTASYRPAAYSQEAGYKKSDDGLDVSLRNAVGGEVSIDSYGGEYEITQYDATVETGKLSEDCAAVSELKNKDFVVFENSNIAERYCNFSFKVDKENVEEVLAVVKNLNPRDLNQNIESIQEEIEDFTSREEILKNKQASINETLYSALSAYEEITALATKTNNADSLAKIIDSKIDILERLTSERLQVNTELDNLARAKAEQLDRLKYVNFYVYIYENKIFDGQVLKDYWISSSQQFVSNINQLSRDLSLGLVEIFIVIVKYLIYIFLFIAAAKLCWKFGKGIWKK